MGKIQLVAPSMEYEEQIREYRNEFLANGDSMDGTSFLREYEDIQDWLDFIERNTREETVTEGLVPATEFLAVRVSDNKLVGMIDIRHTLNDFLLKFGGHIGYSVRRSEWNQGYAKEMLKQALFFTQKLGLEKVLVTCNKTNIASAKVIQANGGLLENELLEDGEPVQRYWIDL
ncbi:GNAT family N-acetyltransferase [Enterococcus sp. BWT-B8]|uniref:GNAT family N-acetyltransferase n=1 Tax=Enterococcus sp. BWT-B8 TaxID=2885157 RepID=UPI001E4448CD|nr:GNAT family N-acetyltransferase [Enterococcus sp. BWT-B8]MCB5951207.1 GNAT family N-acetyltransferase [Enterococcus sp. BWT-B8]